MKNRRILIGVIFIISISVTYAWFRIYVSGNEEAKDITVETGTLGLHFQDGPEIKAENIHPGWNTSKTFTVENTGTLPTNYTIWWTDEFENTIENDELVYSITCKSYSDYGNKTEGGNCFGVEDKVMNYPDDLRLISNIAIEPGFTHEYEITIKFIETSSVQNYNQGKNFYGVINIKEYFINENDVPEIEAYDVTRKVLSATATDEVGITSYAISYPTADLVPADLEWINIKSTRELNLEVDVVDYKATLWVKNRAGNIGYVDLTPKPTLVVNLNGGTWNEGTGSQTYNMTYDETYKLI